ncbi:MAG: ABC transporter ATP-binding protein [Oscillospiraceae bacterium]
MNAIEMKAVTKTYGDFCLDSLSLTLPSGCIMGLVGENGAGKSTTIRLIMNAVAKDSGSIEVLGRDNSDPGFSELKEDIGIVLDEAYFPEILNAKQVGKIMASTYKRWDADCFAAYLQRFSLPLTKSFKDFSRGMKMKLAIAVAMSHAPRLLILDEATSGLDPIVRDEILDIFNEFTRDESHSVLLSSHITSDLEKICDYIAFLHEGKLVFLQEKDQLLENYGILRCSKEDFEVLPHEAIIGHKDKEYSVEALVNRRLLPQGFTAERASIEEIMLFFIKGGSEK